MCIGAVNTRVCNGYWVVFFSGLPARSSRLWLGCSSPLLASCRRYDNQRGSSANDWRQPSWSPTNDRSPADASYAGHRLTPAAILSCPPATGKAPADTLFVCRWSPLLGSSVNRSVPYFRHHRPRTCRWWDCKTYLFRIFRYRVPFRLVTPGAVGFSIRLQPYLSWSGTYAVFQKSDAKIEITITTTNLIRIKYPLSSFNCRLSGAVCKRCKFQQNPPHSFWATAV